jgi:TolA-binding protein
MSEKVTVEQAVQKLSEANNTNNTRLSELENKMTEINLDITEKNKSESSNISSEIMSKLEQNQQQWDQLTSDVRNMKNEIKKICEAITMNQITKNDDIQPIENKTFTPHTDHNSSTTDEAFDPTRPIQHNMTQHIHRVEQNDSYTIGAERTSQTTHTIVIPLNIMHPNIS